MKKFISLLIVFILLLVSVCSQASAFVKKEDVKTDIFEKFSYAKLTDGTVMITDYSGDESVLVIPDKILNYDVTYIYNGAFSSCVNLKKIMIPPTVTNINYDSFKGISDGVEICCYKKSSAEKFAVDNSIKYTNAVVGDFDFNGVFDINDVTCVQKTLARYQSSDVIQNEVGDVNEDNKIGIADVVELQMRLSNVITELKVEKILNDFEYVMNYIYVSLDYNEDTEGFGVTRFNSIMKANDSIKDNTKHNRYTILIADGTYNEWEEMYAGFTDTSKYQGIEAKNYVYYESQSGDPQKCILEWDGSVGYEENQLTQQLAYMKSIFHIFGTRWLDGKVHSAHTHIKGITMRSKNTRYGLHIETGGYGRDVEWTVENCIIEYGGMPVVSAYPPVVGMGMSSYEKGAFINCNIYFSKDIYTNSYFYALMCHDNREKTNLYPVDVEGAYAPGAELIVKNCQLNNYSIDLMALNDDSDEDLVYNAKFVNSPELFEIKQAGIWNVLN